jgi:hypothetical protein
MASCDADHRIANANTGYFLTDHLADNVPNDIMRPQGGTGVTMQNIMEKEPKTSAEPEHREGPIARTIEQQTAKLPSDTFLWAAVGSIGVSLALMMMGQEKKANFVGQWAPTILILGLYNKMVKLHGSEGV